MDPVYKDVKRRSTTYCVPFLGQAQDIDNWPLVLLADLIFKTEAPGSKQSYLTWSSFARRSAFSASSFASTKLPAFSSLSPSEWNRFAVS